MDPRQWLHQNDITPYAWGRRLGLKGAQTVYRYLNGERMPSPRIMDRIHSDTGGQVTAEDFHRLRRARLSVRAEQAA